ncbi:MAG TPA: hypothetical protein VM299_05635 [Solirubrobacteraceae bacterium]|jgi:DNA-binding protein|nr:hypothetical protein [Solirubrobacteraceae bacterium]
MAVHIPGPNHFELSHDDTRIVYALDAGSGAPQLHYSGPMGRHSFEGDAIRIEHSARGREISVTLDTVSHLRTITLTVFVPDVQLDDGGELSFRTVGIHTTRRRKVADAPGAELTTEPLEFDGLARIVEFRAAESSALL